MTIKSIPANNKAISQESLTKVLELLKPIRYGSITLAIQDGVVVQVERNEKIRFR